MRRFLTLFLAVVLTVITAGSTKAFAQDTKAQETKKARLQKEIALLDGHYGLFVQNPARETGDCILRRADGVYAYQLAVSVDDMLMGVTRVVRGRDLLASAPRQKWLIETLGGTAPDYCHAPLLREGEHKLSKRYGSLSTRELRQRYRPEGADPPLFLG